MPHDLVGDLLTILHDERSAIISAQYAALGPLGEAKAQLLTQLSKATPTRTQQLLIKSKLDENQGLLSSAIQGIGTARARLDALHEVQKGLGFYDATGARSTVATRQVGVEKKA